MPHRGRRRTHPPPRSCYGCGVPPAPHHVDAACADGAPAAAPTPRAVGRRLPRLLPWLLGALILVAIATRIPLRAFSGAVRQGPHLQLAGVNLLFNVVVAGTDSLATWIGLLALRMRRRFASVLAVRGATYALYVVNYAVGQGAFGYYLKKSGEPALRAAGATLFLIGTNLATLTMITLAAWSARGAHSGNATLWWMLVAGSAGFAVYLAVIAAAPARLARVQLLAPLFEAGVRGHLLAVLGRLPHVLFVIVGQWAAVRVWGIDLPFATGMTAVPVVVIASVLPITPVGLGTAQAAMVLLFSDFAAGASVDDRQAAVLAFAIVHFVYGTLGSLTVGLACLPFARRAGDIPAAR